MGYRKLNAEEINALKQQGCSAENWDNLSVQDGFTPAQIRNTRFAGQVRLGVFADKIEVDTGISKTSGLYNSYIQDCTIGDNVYISDVKNLVHYTIENHAVIENVGSLTVSGESTFGNGIEIEIVNEGGGREVPIFDRLSSQIAYIMAHYRHDRVLIEKLHAMIDKYVADRKSGQGTIGRGVRIVNCALIRNVKIAAFARISGALRLEEGTVDSCEEDPTRVGEGVVAKNFIILSGSSIDSCAMLSDCFAGQGVQLGKQYSAENSAFFANAEGFHGEACSIFAGPYTVTHHKSTLLIAGLFSFFNAGSGTNQSNHMYKLGPLHQGILERGSKTGSFSYLLWPCRVGAFTAVIGKHNSNFDTSDLPFSYITDESGKSLLTPAMNIFTVGTRRDSVKWPNRDRRKDPRKLDLINFEFFSPYLVGKMVRGIEALRQLYENASKKQEYVNYNGIQIKRLLLKTCAKYYELAISIYIGNEILKRFEGLAELVSFEAVKEKLLPAGSEGLGDWVDLAGMLVSSDVLDKFLNSVRTGQLTTIDELQQRLQAIHNDYSKTAWVWCVDLIQKRLGTAIMEITPQQLIQLISDWRKNSIKLNNMILKDAEKEFDANSRIGFGIDGDDAIKTRDFDAVRGSYEDNKFVIELKNESETIQQRADELIAMLENRRSSVNAVKK